MEITGQTVLMIVALLGLFYFFVMSNSNRTEHSEYCTETIAEMNGEETTIVDCGSDKIKEENCTETIAEMNEEETTIVDCDYDK